MVINDFSIEDKPKEQIVILPVGCKVLAATGGDAGDRITLSVQFNPAEIITDDHVFQVVKTGEEFHCIVGEYIGSVRVSNGSMRHVFGGIAPVPHRGEFCYVNALTQETDKGGQVKKTKGIKCVFTSVWDGDITVETPAVYDPETGYIEVLSAADVGGLQVLEREYITLPDGEEIAVCPVCHEYTMRSCMVPSTHSKDFLAAKECRNPDCGNKA
jgi:hypothetical protein